MEEDYQWCPLAVSRTPMTKQWCVERARECLQQGARAPIGIYKLVAIVRADPEIKIEVLDGDE